MVTIRQGIGGIETERGKRETEREKGWLRERI